MVVNERRFKTRPASGPAKRQGRCAAVAAVICGVACAAPGALVSERWGGKAAPCTHPDTLRVVKTTGGVRLVFDLSAIPRDAKVHRARLGCFTQDDAQPTDPAVIRIAGEGGPEGQPLALVAPWYRSFDATAAVRRWAADPKANRGLAVERFEGLLPERTCLEVVYEGEPSELPPQVTGVRAVHHDGQTFVAWREHPAFRPKAEEVVWIKQFVERGDVLADGPGQGAGGMPNHPAITLRALRRLQGLGLRTTPSGFQGIRELKRIGQVPAITCRVYRHTEPITAGNVLQAEMLAEVDPLSGLDDEVYKIHFQGEYLNQWEDPNSVIPTLCVDKGKALAPGEGLYVHTPAGGGKGYYAVTAVLAGTEDLSRIGPDNSLAQPIDEAPATPQPVLQWLQVDQYKPTVPEYWYRYWAAPPYGNLPSRSYRLAVAVGDKFQAPGPLIIDTISGAFNVRESIRVPKNDAITILIQRQLDWLPALFYNAGRGTLRGMTDCPVDYFSERYMSFMIHWTMGKYQIDRSRISGGLLHFGLRHPEIFTRMSFGSYTAGYDLRIAPGGPSMPRILGPQGIKTARGEDAWKMYSVAEYVHAHPERDIPFLLCVSGTGKDGGHTSEFGWQDDPRGWRGLLDARQPFVASWSTHPPRELTAAFEKMRWDVALPAFSRGSLDNNPGNGNPADGDYYGCINGWLLWDDQAAVDEAGRWEMAVWLIPSCPEDRCTVDVTPRRCRNFKPKPGQTLAWTQIAADGAELGKGTVAADRWGLVTLKQVPVTKAPSRLRIAAR